MTCVCGKLSYADQRDAQRVMGVMRHNSPRGKPKEALCVYVCRHSGLYHVGHDRKVITALQQRRHPPQGADHLAAAKARARAYFAGPPKDR